MTKTDCVDLRIWNFLLRQVVFVVVFCFFFLFFIVFAELTPEELASTEDFTVPEGLPEELPPPMDFAPPPPQRK
jgi:hypothetical protein